ncbi:MAG: RpoL/Rpb11 RNA polymerase subunit family protein [Nanoarchaeota archaeon]
MQLEFLKDEKEEAKVRFPNENSIFANAIKDELWLTKGVEIATLDKRHPLVGKPELVIQGKEPRKLMKTAAQNLKKKVEDFEKAILKEI